VGNVKAMGIKELIGMYADTKTPATSVIGFPGSQALLHKPSKTNQSTIKRQ